MNNCFLIIGSSGQIGSALTAEFMQQGVAVCGIDPRPNPWLSGLSQVQTRFEDLADDLLAQQAVTDLVLLATTASARQLEEHPDLDAQDRDRIEKALVWALRHHLRLTIVSSRELFGHTLPKLLAMEPTSRYETQKRDMEVQAARLAEHGGTVNVFRVPIVFGGYDTDLNRISRLVPRWCAEYVNTGKIALSNGNKVLELAECKRVSRTIVDKLLEKQAGFTVEDIRGSTITLQELADAIATLASGRTTDVPDEIVAGIRATLQLVQHG